jgi:hypothetical protein
MSFVDARLEVPRPDVRERPIWYQLMYNLAAHQAHLSMEPRRNRRAGFPILQRAAPSFFGDALATATVLLAASSTTLMEIDAAMRRRRWWERNVPQPRSQLRTFLGETMEPASAVLVAGLLNEQAGQQLERSLTIEWRDEIPELVLQRRDIEPAALSAALVQYVLELPRISYRVHYNLACYFSGLLSSNSEKVADNSLQELRTALQTAPDSERRSLAAWAPQDPSLDELRRRRESDFNELLTIYIDLPLEPRRWKLVSADQ